MLFKNMFASLALLICLLSFQGAFVQGFVVPNNESHRSTALYFRPQSSSKNNKATATEEKATPPVPTYKITKLQLTTTIVQADKHQHHRTTPIMKQVRKQAMGLLLRTYEMDRETFGVAL